MSYPLTRVEVPLPPRLPVQLIRLVLEATTAVGRPPTEDGQEAVHDPGEQAARLAAGGCRLLLWAWNERTVSQLVVGRRARARIKGAGRGQQEIPTMGSASVANIGGFPLPFPIDPQLRFLLARDENDKSPLPPPLLLAPALFAL